MVLNKQEMIAYLESNYGSWDEVTNLAHSNVKSHLQQGWDMCNTRTPSNPEYSLWSKAHLLLFIWEHEVDFNKVYLSNPVEMKAYLKENYTCWDDVVKFEHHHMKDFYYKTGWRISREKPSGRTFIYGGVGSRTVYLYEDEVEQVEQLLLSAGIIGASKWKKDNKLTKISESHSDISNYYTKAYKGDEVTADSVCTVAGDIGFYITDGLI